MNMKSKSIKAGVYTSAMQLPHPKDASRIYPANAPFEIKGDDCEDSWVVMQVTEGVFTPVESPKEEKAEKPSSKKGGGGK